MAIPEGYDFSGWASKNDLRCEDGRVIRRGAFASQNGKKVPLFWNHKHDSVDGVLGHALLENRDEGLYAYGYFNNTPSAKHAKEAVKNGDINSMSIWANNLKQQGPDVSHGVVREVSLVPAGANPGAFIESVMIHGVSMGEDDEEGIIYTGENLILSHAVEEPKKEEKSVEDGTEKKEEGGKTIAQIYNGMTDEQKEAVAVIVGAALEDAEGSEEPEEDEGGDDNMKHSAFDNSHAGEAETKILTREDMQGIIAAARKGGSLRDAIHSFCEENELDQNSLMHSIDKTGMTTATGTQTYGFNDPNMLFPDYKSLNTPPEWISRNMEWVNRVMAGVRRTPFSRIKSLYADITEDEARARGYIKGKQKKTEVFTTLKRTTDPQTVYKLQKLDRDDVIDITDFDVVAWIRAEMRVMLNEELARAILIGDGRQADSDDKIQEAHIRPIVSDVPLFNIKVTVTAGKTSAETADAQIEAILRARKSYKGSGNPVFFTTEDVLTEMLLLKDGIGHRLYKTEAELATALRVSSIVTVEAMEGHKVDGKNLVGVIVNLADYTVGADKGGAIANFDDFDIDFNKYSYLIETRCSGALTKPFSAMTILMGEATDESENA